MTVDDKSLNTFKLWHACLGYLASQILSHVTQVALFVGFLTFWYQVKHQFLLIVKLDRKQNVTSLFLLNVLPLLFSWFIMTWLNFQLNFDDYFAVGTCHLFHAKSHTSWDFSEWVMCAKNQTLLSLSLFWLRGESLSWNIFHISLRERCWTWCLCHRSSSTKQMCWKVQLNCTWKRGDFVSCILSTQNLVELHITNWSSHI